MPSKKLTKREKDLVKRYLIWCYKTTKEELDRIDRYFTQNIADIHILKHLRSGKDYRSKAPTYKGYQDLVDQFRRYMDVKTSNALKKKFNDKKHTKLNSEYRYLVNRFHALENTIVHFLGVKQLKAIDALYEEEMTRRIIEAREHT